MLPSRGVGAALLGLLVGMLAAAAATVAPDPWQRAIGPWHWSFPRDHGAHPAFRTEWWYFTGNLENAQHRRFGYQLTFFRQGLQFTPVQQHSRWAARDFYFAHFTITDIAANRFHTEERVSRGALGEAAATEGAMNVKLGRWSVVQNGDEAMQLAADGPGMSLQLRASPAKPLILEGVNGLSQKAGEAGAASYYYSYPRLATSGELVIDGTRYTVSGLSWFDHEFSTSSLSSNEVGWDWFCFQLENHEEVMLYLLRDRSGAIDASSEGTWVRADGTSQRLPPGSFQVTTTATWKSPSGGAVYPAGWQVTIPSHAAKLAVHPAMADQELRLIKMGALNYWEGACTIHGSLGAKDVGGVGYTELTGYSGSLQASFKE